VKLSGNFLIASMIEALGEALALVDKSGVPQRTFVDIITSTLFDTPVYRTYATLIAERRFEPAGFAAPLGFKRRPSGIGRRGRRPRPDAAREPVAGSVPGVDGAGRRRTGLVGDRPPAGHRCGYR
jgi:hypothetical protein